MRPLITYGLIASSALFSWSQVRINELMASNTRAFPDVTDFEDYPDWLELHNPGTEKIKLEGYFLSDDPSAPLKWGFAPQAEISAGEYLVVIADGKDTPKGRSFRRPYWPFANVMTEKHHTNFSLSSSGESLILTKTDLSSRTIIPPGSRWAYLDDGSNQRTEWKAPGFDDSEWQTGPAPLGYGDDPATELDFGDPDDRHITSYLRHDFQVADPTTFDALKILIQVDDGAIAYLNGFELLRQNMRAGSVTQNTTSLSAVTPDLEEIWHEFLISSEALVSGNNVLAVEVHQTSKSSVDMRFDLELQSITFSNPTQLDSLTFPSQVTDISLGRDPNDESQWVNFTFPSPGRANEGNLVSDLREASGETEISPSGGVFSEPQTISLSAKAGQIHYTLDGREPSEDDPVFTESFTITSSTVVRARTIEAGKVPGPISTKSYLIGEIFSKDIPILSIVTDPATLFDDRIGIYLNQHEPNVGVGPAVYKGKDAPGHLELFNADGSEGFVVNGSYRMGGENNWASHLQRAFNFSTKGKFGDDQLKYDLFPGSGIPVLTALTIREGGDDYGSGRINDPIFDRIAEGRLNVETNKSRPAEVYINGEYWGHYNIRDRWNENWFFQHYGTDNGEYDHISFEGTSESQANTENGTRDTWFDFYDFVRNNDLTDPTVWEFIESRMDVDSFIDFLAAESWGNNTSWTGNREVWKPHRPGTKWRWFIPDMDRTFRTTSSNELADMANREQMFKYLKANTRFKNRLAQRYSAHLATTFSNNRIFPIIDQMGAEILPSIARTRERWGNTLTVPEYQSRIEGMKSFTRRRNNGAQKEIQNLFELSDPVPVTLAITGEGNVEIAGLEVSPMQLLLFPSLETDIRAIPAPGFEFDYWIGIDGEASTTFTPENGTVLIAKFTPISNPPLSGFLARDTTLEPHAVYDVSSDLIVPAGVTLTIPQGVEIRMDPSTHLRVMGSLQVEGSSENPVKFHSRTDSPWGGISFETPDSPSALTHLIVRDTTRGEDPVTYPSGISGLDADLSISNLDISGRFGPLFFRGGALALRDSLINIPVTGDGINVKQGSAITERCTFTGNTSLDTDAIDYDGVVDGIIRDCRIYNFRGFNSDGIDTGEQCVNILIEGNTIFYNSDKGISVGQGSEVILRNNLIVGCAQGVGVKDFGSSILVDQNTFVDCLEGVAVFEKNFAAGGGGTIITNTIFSDCEIPVSVDEFSTLNVRYSLSDTLPLPGTNNLRTGAQFLDPAGLNFELSTISPARNAGDPLHEPDPDGSRVDMGAIYTFDPEDYPFLNNNVIVVNEVLANSGDAGDWIELHNRTSNPIDISGWFLSDDGSQLEKYLFPENTIINGGGYLVLTEEDNFGPDNLDPARLTDFALSATGETIHLSSPKGYHFSETFGSSNEGVSLGFYFKESTNSYNFVAQASPSQGFTNGDPAVGPIVISEIMVDPANEGAEFLELVNITSSPVTLFDSARNLPWEITDGIEFTFPTAPLVMAAGERLILTRNIPAFKASFSIPGDTQILQWSHGRLSDGGESIQLSRPGLPDKNGRPTFIRVDRVNYDTSAPWPSGVGLSIQRKIESLYGNDFVNWRAALPTPGSETPTSPLEQWLAEQNILNPSGDEDSDGLKNLFEYAIGSNPHTPNLFNGLNVDARGGEVLVTYPTAYQKPGIQVILESSQDLVFWNPENTGQEDDQEVFAWTQESQIFFRLRVTE
ncbi:MAG: lamin tail domain-containing protein [Akkermansiaceae bacterium]